MVEQRIVAICLAVLSDLIKHGILSHMLISKILNKKYSTILSNLLADDRIDQVLKTISIVFMANCRYELEDFDLHKGRYFNFYEEELDDVAEDAL